MWLKVLDQILKMVQPVVDWMETKLNVWTTPITESLVVGTVNDLIKSKPALVAENAFLRQQLMVLKRQVKQPKLTDRDRGLLVLLASRVRHWKNALLLVKPDTLLRWHREGFKLFWRLKSKAGARKPRIAEETITLIKQMALVNRRWGTKRIQGELLKLGVHANRGTIGRYMQQARRSVPPQPHGQTWATFLKNHAHEIWACDFVQTFDLFFRPIFLFFMIEHHSRRVVHIGVTRTPTDAWVAQQVREATPFGSGPRFLICDNDAKYGLRFNHAAIGAGIDIVHTPYFTPKANALCERFIGSVRRECLDFILIWSEAHGRRVMREYITFFNQARPHQGIQQQIPVPPAGPPTAHRKVVAHSVLGGLHHDYRRSA